MNNDTTTHAFRSGLAVNSPHTRYTPNHIITEHVYSRNHIEKTQNGVVTVQPRHHRYVFKTQTTPQRTGIMIVGLGGSNATTLLGTILANTHNLTWHNNFGEVLQPNYYGSLTQSTTIRIGSSAEGVDMHLPFNKILPMLQPQDIAMPFGGWDINSDNLGDAMKKNKIFAPELQEKLYPYMKNIKPLPAAYNPSFINENQHERATQCIQGTLSQQLKQLRLDIRNYKSKHNLQHVTVMFCASTEKSAEVSSINSTSTELLHSISRNCAEIPPSVLYAVASILEGCPFVVCSSQNTICPGLLDLAARRNVQIVGDDLKSGQTKARGVFVDFLVSSGFKLRSTVSYNHLGNNDGKNLSAWEQRSSQKTAKTTITDDMCGMNGVLYKPNEKIDTRTIVRYVPHVGDDKRSTEEYSSEICMHHPHTMVVNTIASDSLLAAPLLLDMIILLELFNRITIHSGGNGFQSLDPLIGGLLGYFMKSPHVAAGTPVTHALMKQQRQLTNFICCVAGIIPDADLHLEHFTQLPKPLPMTPAML